MVGESAVTLREVETLSESGVVWSLEESEDLNANWVRFPTGEGVGQHVSDEVNVILLRIAGSGFVNVDGEDYHLADGTLIFVPTGARRSTRSAAEDFAYLTVHRRRGPLRLGNVQKTRGGT